MPVRRSDDLGVSLEVALERNDVVWVGGDCGVGKSVRTPPALLQQLSCRGKNKLCGIAHCVPTHVAIRNVFEYYQIQGDYVSELACKWHGRISETHMHPRHPRFVALCTPVSLFRRFQLCYSWGDIRYIILDEVG